MKFLAAIAIASVSATEYNPMDISIDTRSWGSEISWTITDPQQNVLCKGGPYKSHSEETISCQLEDGSYTLTCLDSYGDGWHGGSFNIDGANFCKDFRTGYKITHTFRKGAGKAE